MPSLAAERPGAFDPDLALEAIRGRVRAFQTEGIDDMRALLERAPEHVATLGALAWGLAQRGEHEEAVALYRRMAELRPGDLEARWRAADRLVNLGRLDEALEAYRAVAKEAPDCLDATIGVRYVLHLKRQEGRPREAREVVERAPLTEAQRANDEANRAEFEAAKTRLDSLPSWLFLESTTKCNFFCKTCSKGYAPYYAEDLRVDIKEKVRAELVPTMTRMSATGFGEPTMAADFDAIMDLALENGAELHFVTNGSLLHFERVEKLARKPADIAISVDGATKKTFEEVRAGANFDLVLEKLATIKKLRDIHLSQIVSRFHFYVVALRRNLDELAGIVRLAARFDIRSVVIHDYNLSDTDFDEQSPRYEPERANAALREARAAAAELGVQLATPPDYQPLPPPKRPDSFWRKLRSASRRLFSEPNRFPSTCSSPWREPYIVTDGRVRPCCMSGEIMGDLRKQSFREIWNGWRYRLMRARMKSPVPPIPCRECITTWGINAGNAGNSIAKEGLFVRAFYFAEGRMIRLSQRLKKRFAKAAEPAPNFEKGRPMAAAKPASPEQA